MEHRLFPGHRSEPVAGRPVPDWSTVAKELGRKGGTLMLLWQEYRREHPDGYEYTWWTTHFRRWQKKADAVMRQDRKAGDAMYVDYAGDTMKVIDPQTGEIRTAQLFVAALGVSSYTYVEAMWSQDSESCVMAHAHAMSFYGGVPASIVPDNLKAAVKTPHRFEPEIARPMQEMARFYGTTVIPARVRKPRDKATVENAVLQVERWIMAPLRDRKFFSLQELNRALQQEVNALNNRALTKIDGTRHSIFTEVDSPVLSPLPPTQYSYGTWTKLKVSSVDYHVESDKHYYSVPVAFLGHTVEVRTAKFTVEVFYRQERIASHPRVRGRPGGHSTVKEHMPTGHQKHLEWTPDRIEAWGESIGPHTHTVVCHIMATRTHPVQGLRACLGILSLAKRYGNQRVENACHRINNAGGDPSFRSIESLLIHNLDTLPLESERLSAPPLTHDNIRGKDAYSQEAFAC